MSINFGKKLGNYAMNSPLTQNLAFVDEEEETSLLPFSLFSNNKEFRFAVSVHKVREVVEYKECTQLAPSFAPFLAVLDYRGVPVPVFDLCKHVFSDDFSPQIPYDPRVIIANIDEKLIGILTQRTYPMHSVFLKDILPFGMGQNISKNLPASGFINIEGTHVVLIDCDNLLFPFIEDPSDESPLVSLPLKEPLQVVKDQPSSIEESTPLFSEEGEGWGFF
jgi:chemotaxis signal transduction protein